MLFASIDFAIFLPIVFIFYWWVFNNKLKSQNTLIFIASCVFYGWWDWMNIFIILFSIVFNFIIGVSLEKFANELKRKILLWISISVNLGVLGYFKYFNFFIDSFIKAFSLLGNPINIQGLEIALPIGISFYTFQTISYILDVYYEKIKPTNDFFAFGAFVSFFPLLLAGPIERATKLLTQFKIQRQFNYSKAVDGCKQILWGFFKKVVIADNCAFYVEEIFRGYNEFNSATLLLGAILYSFQIYCDFSGYSDIAIGISRLFGFNLMQNFAFPYFARDISEFWRKWHISLTSWFTEYLYFPLSFYFRKLKRFGVFLSVFITFTISGFWHGASWNFIFWGMLHGALFLPSIYSKKSSSPFTQNTNNIATIKDLPKILFLFFTISLTSIFFRAKYMERGLHYISIIFKPSKWGIPELWPNNFMILILIFILIEWLGREGEYGLQTIGLKRSRLTRWMIYYAILYTTTIYSSSSQQFIYFQF
jgi:alginate O-acetyltransferase complex protein AlgI